MALLLVAACSYLFGRFQSKIDGYIKQKWSEI